jgi:hypothetical protein
MNLYAQIARPRQAASQRYVRRVGNTLVEPDFDQLRLVPAYTCAPVTGFEAIVARVAREAQS